MSQPARTGEVRQFTVAADDEGVRLDRWFKRHLPQIGFATISRWARTGQVRVDGKRVNSCLTLAIMKDGAEVTTIEGLARGDELHPLQEAFVEHDAFQCGYCTPGQICSAVGLLREGKARTADDIRELMSGNLCRCGAYSNIVVAVEQVLRKQGEVAR